MLYPGLSALGPKMYIGHAALGTKNVPRAVCPEYKTVLEGRQYLGLSAVFTQGLQIMTSVITQYSSFVQPLQACKDSTLLDVTIMNC